MENNQTPEQNNHHKTPKENATTTPYDYNEIFKHVVKLGKELHGNKFEIHDIDRPAILKLLIYFLRDQELAKTEGVQLEKGLLVTGPIGCGKTSLIRIIRNFAGKIHQPVIKACREVCYEYGNTGFDTIYKYTRRSFDPYTKLPRIYCFDDLGVEKRTSYWGNELNVMEEILLSRHDLMFEYNMKTYATSSKNADELETIYGKDVRSRMRAMFTLIAFDPESKDKR